MDRPDRKKSVLVRIDRRSQKPMPSTKTRYTAMMTQSMVVSAMLDSHEKKRCQPKLNLANLCRPRRCHHSIGKHGNWLEYLRPQTQTLPKWKPAEAVILCLIRGLCLE